MNKTSLLCRKCHTFLLDVSLVQVLRPAPIRCGKCGHRFTVYQDKNRVTVTVKAVELRAA